VKANTQICTDHYRLTLSVEQFPGSVPGQFVQVECREQSDAATDAGEPRTFEWMKTLSLPHDGRGLEVSDPDFIAPRAFLRRPFSIADHRIASDGAAEIDIIHRVVGKGTRVLAQLRAGQTISILGPLGRGFTAPDNLKLACLVGGGVGIPPMLYLGRHLHQRSRKAIAFLGAQRQDLFPIHVIDDQSRDRKEATGSELQWDRSLTVAAQKFLNVQEFGQYGYPSILSTDDGSLGMKGLITQALDRFLRSWRIEPGVIIYCCGPTAMMKATAAVAEMHNVVCQVSLEQPMACGMGTCQSCIIKYRAHDVPATDTNWQYKLTCTDGPVFDSRDVLW